MRDALRSRKVKEIMTPTGVNDSSRGLSPPQRTQPPENGWIFFSNLKGSQNLERASLLFDHKLIKLRTNMIMVESLTLEYCSQPIGGCIDRSPTVGRPPLIIDPSGTLQPLLAALQLLRFDTFTKD
jgi:hypothetical protein